ncbi:DUF6428 family protein [Litoribacter populi]|uniref:DUF6428 family protein n=1 Tax=Litoribacter populi TaxID=2598460 RepID=UPI00117C7C35|nr:DUF6428 family protein [Litoribacter populi]
MKTSEFTQLLESNPETPLYFEYLPGQYARPDFHITEIKNVSFDTVDCGGKRNQWEETHVQLWENEIPEPGHSVDTTKALKIFQLVDKVRPTFQDTEIKIEYGNSQFPATTLPISDVLVLKDKIIIQLTTQNTTCKAKDRATTPEEKAAACCGPVNVKPKIRLSQLEGSSCQPDSGCC